VPLRLGDVSDEVRLIQTRLNRISKNYPGIPKISDPPGVFAAGTEAAVLAFQRQFDLTPDGVVGRATWYSIARIYAAVKKLTDVNSEGIPASDVALLFGGNLETGDTGTPVRELQYLLAVIAFFSESVRPVTIDGIFGSTTRGAVEDFQYDAGLPVTGVVDETTWNAIYDNYRVLLDSLPDNYFTSTTLPYPGSPLRVGSRGEYVVALQNYLNRISDVYTEIPIIDVDGVYGIRTRDAVRVYQRIFGIPETGVTGAATWDSVANTYRTIVDGDYGSRGQFGGELGS